MRISKYKGPFEKGYVLNWTKEIFYVDSKVVGREPVVYKLKDYDGHVLKGTFYTDELQIVGEPSVYDIYRVLKRRVNALTGERELYVSWEGYPKSFNQWIPESYMTRK